MQVSPSQFHSSLALEANTRHASPQQGEAKIAP